MTERESLISKAKEYMKNAYTPYSKFNVGAAILTDDGRIFGGCNIENSSYGAAICAERTAAVKAVSEGAKHFKAIAVVCSTGEYAYPCGICRQFVLYLEDKEEGELSIPFFDSIPYFFTGDRIK